MSKKKKPVVDEVMMISCGSARHTSDGRTFIFDEDGDVLFRLSGRHDLESCRVIAHVYKSGVECGRRIGSESVRHSLRTLLGVKGGE